MCALINGAHINWRESDMATLDNQHTYDIDSLLFAMQQKNLVYNYDFRYFSNQTNTQPIKYNHPDGWIYSDPGNGSQISSENNGCRIVTSTEENATMSFRQNIHEFPRWKETLCSEHISCVAQLNVKGTGELHFCLSDGITYVQRTYTIQNSQELNISTELEIAMDAKTVFVELSCSSPSVVISVKKIFANKGYIALASLPCIVAGVIGERKQYVATEQAPAEELPLCTIPIALNSDQTRLNSVINYRFGKQGEFSLLPDFRGYFSRAWDNSAGRDKNAKQRKMSGDSNNIGDLVGTTEPDIFKEHQHTITFKPVNMLNPEKGSPAYGVNLAASTQTQITTEGDLETRPINIAELFTIKWA